ncbi:hypothetical protein EAE90_20855 [Photorhabdus caribbeanensis]|nr:hypothetical protein [Photorhabdus caribbeanensis]
MVIIVIIAFIINLMQQFTLMIFSSFKTITSNYKKPHHIIINNILIAKKRLIYLIQNQFQKKMTNKKLSSISFHIAHLTLTSIQLK